MMKLKWMVAAAVAMFFLAGVASAGVYPEDNGAAGYAGAVLPERVINLELQNHTVMGTDKAFDDKGEEIDAPVKDVSVQAQAIKINYGIFDWLTFQIGAPIVVSSERKLNQKGVVKTDDYKYYEALVTKIAAQVSGNIIGALADAYGGTADRDAKTTALRSAYNTSTSEIATVAERMITPYIEAGWSITRLCNQFLKLDAAQAVCITETQGNSIYQAINATARNVGAVGGYLGGDYITNSDDAPNFSVTNPLQDEIASWTAGTLVGKASAQQKGATGLGDMEIGALSQLIGPKGVLMKDFFGAPVAMSFGAAFRLPTGKYTEVDPSKTSTGDGTLDFGVRTTFDYNPIAGLVVGWENDIEKALTNAKKLDYSTLTHHPGTTHTTYKQRGLRYKGYVKVAFGFKPYVESLKILGLGYEYAYDIGHRVKAYDKDDREVLYLNSTGGKSPQMFTHKVNVELDFKQMRLPLDLQLQYWMNSAGRNQASKNTGLYAKLRVYYKF